MCVKYGGLNTPAVVNLGLRASDFFRHSSFVIRISIPRRRHAALGRVGHRARTGAARADFRTRASRGANDWGNTMNLLPSLRPVLDELTQRFGTQIEGAHAPQPNELYLHAKLELAGALCSALY